MFLNMSGLEFNKIIASIIIAIIVFAIISLMGNYIVKTNTKENQETAYIIEIPETTNESVSQISLNAESLESINSLLLNANLENGAKIYKKCGTCHNYEKNSKSKAS